MDAITASPPPVPPRPLAGLVLALWLSAGALPGWAQDPTLPTPRPADGSFFTPTFGTPAPATLFRAESEATFRARLRPTAAGQLSPRAFPPDAPAPVVPQSSAGFPPAVCFYQSTELCHNPLYFEPQHANLYVWATPAAPLFQAGGFYLRVLLLPASLVMQPPWTHECSRIDPLPGALVPCP